MKTSSRAADKYNKAIIAASEAGESLGGFLGAIMPAMLCSQPVWDRYLYADKIMEAKDDPQH